jgi:hypothetical protein
MALLLTLTQALSSATFIIVPSSVLIRIPLHEIITLQPIICQCQGGGKENDEL